ncbi:MAG: LamG domain-containing protein [bacterium]|nr:LamG domain-containing protein [bacterium]
MIDSWLAFGLVAVVCVGACCASGAARGDEVFTGEYFSGEGDAEYVRLLDTARRMFDPDPEYQNLPMLYTPAWNGLVEGPTWGAWWIQNSYGPTYCALPFLTEPYVTFLQNSQDLWFDQMGDGKRAGGNGYVAPDGSLCDAASPGWIVYRQGDGRHAMHDWGMEFTAAGCLMQAELLLISRDEEAIAHYLPKLERCANFIESRRDPENDLFLAGAAGNLLAPSYAGWKKPDGTYGKAYLAGLSVSYIAALDRLIELERLAGNAERAEEFTKRRDAARRGLAAVTTAEGYLIKSLDPDGTRHGVYGAPKHGYFEASPNHDAIAFRVVDDDQARRIYDTIVSIPGLRRHDVIIANEPGLDDMYESPTSWLWKHGTWVNGGHWSTCEARMVMGYYRLGAYADARRSVEHMIGFARQFRMDNPLVEFGSRVYQPKQPVNLCYDSFGPLAACVRGQFEYLYKADELVLIPHIPPTITRLEQRFPIRFGEKRIYIATSGAGEVTGVRLDGAAWEEFDRERVRLPYDAVNAETRVEILLGGASPAPWQGEAPRGSRAVSREVLASRLDSMPRAGGTNLPLRIGADSNGENRFVGDIREVRVYHRALPIDEVKASKSGKSAPDCAASWRFAEDGSEVAIQASSEELGGKIEGSAAVKDGCLRLDGRGWVTIPASEGLDLDGPFTIEAVIRPGVLQEGGARIVDRITVGENDGYLIDTHPQNALRLICPTGTLSSEATLAPDVWQHVAATRDADGKLRLYLDGVLVAEGQGAAKPIKETDADFLRVASFSDLAAEKGLTGCYEARHAALVLDCVAVASTRAELRATEQLPELPEASRAAADLSYTETAIKLCQGFVKTLESYADTDDDAHGKLVYELWCEAGAR